MSDDETIRLWSIEGAMVYMFGYHGGSANAMYIDNVHRLVIAATQDCYMRVYDLEDPAPKAKYDLRQRNELYTS